MNTEGTSQVSTTARTPKQRRAYHSPRVEDYGAVNELTRSGGTGYNPADGPSYYISIPG